MSFTLSDFFNKALAHYRVQPFHLPPNSITTLTHFVALCEGYLGIRPRLDLFSFYYQIKRLTIQAGGPLCWRGSVSFKIRRSRNYPKVVGHESARNWTGSYFYCKDIPKEGKEVGWPVFVDGPAEPVAS
jgi:hypothetical protein